MTSTRWLSQPSRCPTTSSTLCAASDYTSASCASRSNRPRTSHMRIQASLTKPAARALALVGAVLVYSLLLWLVLERFVIATLTDDRVGFSQPLDPSGPGHVWVSRDVLRSAVGYFPDSPSLQSRLAEAEMV